MTHPLVQLEIDGLDPDALRVSELRGREAISELFSFDLVAVTATPDAIDAEAIAAASATLVFSRDGVETRRIHGMITLVREDLDAEPSHATYRLKFGPRAFRLTMIETLDIYLDKSVPEIIAHKLELVGLSPRRDFEMRLDESRYPAREFVVQYRETDIAFISRITEHLGISFFFEHKDGRDVLVFADANAAFPPIGGGGKAHFRGRGERREVYALERTTRLIPTTYVVRDYNYRKPQLDLTAAAEAPDGFGGGIVEYGAHFKTPDEGERIATVRAEEQRCTRRVLVGESDVAALAAGAKVHLEGHARGDLHLLLLEVTHTLHQTALGAARDGEAGYHNTFRAIPADVPFRPARVTPKPRVHGMLTGVIDAAQRGKYAEIDEEGRYRVRFLYDTAHTPEGRASRPLRMMQPHTGEGYGMHFPLRPGVEVLITCVDGDPDRPIIAGTVPNAFTTSPVTANNAPRNIVRTGGGNELNIDDSEGSERIKLTTPHSDTTFQLGAPNSPEVGAALETRGAVSTVAGNSVNAFTTLKSTLSLLKDFRSSGSIYSVAEPPDWAAKVGKAGALIGGVLGATSAGLEVVLAARDLSLKQVATFKVAAESKLAKAQEQADRALTDFEAAEKAMALPKPSDPPLAEPSPDPKQRLADADKASDDADATAAAAADALIAAEEAYDELIRKNEGGPTNATIERAAKAKADAEKAAQAAAQAAKEARDKFDRTRLEVHTSNPELRAALTAYSAARDRVTQTSGALAAQKRAMSYAKKVNLDATYHATESTTAQAIGHVKQLLADAKMGVEILFSVAMAAYTFVKFLRERQLEDTAQEKATEKVVAALPKGTFVPSDFWNRPAPASLLAKLMRKGRSQHVVGSSDTTRVYGEQHVFVHGGSAALAADATALVAGKNISIAATDQGEIAAPKGVAVTSRDGLAETLGKKVLVTATTNTARGSDPSKDGDVRIVAETKLELEAAKEGVSVVARKGDIAFTANLDAGQKVSAAAKEVSLAGEDKADALAGMFGLRATPTAATIGNTSWQLKVADKNVELGTAGSAQLTITDSAAQLVGDTKLTLGATDVSIAADRVAFGSAVISSDDLTVRGMGVSVELVILKGKIKAAQMLAETAKSIAETQANLTRTKDAADLKTKMLVDDAERQREAVEVAVNKATQWTPIADNWVQK